MPHAIPFVDWSLRRLVALFALVAISAVAQTPAEFDRLLDSFPLVDDIDTAAQAPIHQFPDDASKVATLLDRPARVLPMGDTPKVMGWVIGKGKGLKAGTAYVLEVEYPDDLPRTIFVANRGADLVRGFATGSATGDSRQQYVQPSIESLNYPQTRRWQSSRTVFFLHDRFQGIYAQRDPKPGGRPFTPANGFHVLVFQTKQVNDARSEGAAIGRIRLRSVPDITALYPKVEPLPAELPRRRIFFREEMADEAIQAKEVNDRGVAEPVDWLVYKARISRMLAINTFTKDLLEFGHNQGWNGGDGYWINNAQPPLTDLWERAVPRLAAEGLDLLPYYEYKGAIGWSGAPKKSLGLQRRAEKLYHNLPNTRYTGVYWTEGHNADLTDPDTLADAIRVLDKTITPHKDKAKFAGAWFRVRDNHLPISFADAAVARFRAACPDDAIARTASRATLIASYEGDRRLYDTYIDWWLKQRAAFLSRLAEHVAKAGGNEQAQFLFTPWTTEQIPMMRNPETGKAGHPAQITTDDPAWWDAYAKKQTGWFRWALAPTSWDRAVAGNYYRWSLEFREPIVAPQREEHFHSAPGADPANYRDNPRVMLTFPIGRLFTVASAELMDSYRTGAGLTAVRHYTLNEDSHDRAKPPANTPFDGQMGYISVDADRAGAHVRLLEARAIANGDPRNLGYLCGSSFSTGFPGHVRRFNQAFVSVPALPSTVVKGAASDGEVIVREIRTPKHGTYYFVVNTSMQPKSGIAVTLPAKGTVRDLLDHRDMNGANLRLDMDSAELRSYRVAP